ncbi:C-GCAxxG-C-C family protein [Prevotellamassilia timonensis]|uniref:C-GCAxxG-C-C family protein n=1 Tax=Prevotellamassilia timonensis TaxID=1852370 RepID=UPI0040263EFC
MVKVHITPKEADLRVERAVQLFKEGYNCSQSVVGAFADLYGFTQEQALLMSASFGGGIGRMRQTCGAACGMFVLAGLQSGTTIGSDREGKSRNYAMVQQLAESFKQINGSIICSDILGLTPNADIPAQASARTESYYKTRPCSEMVRTAARLFANAISQD